jgi:hypothetical protein
MIKVNLISDRVITLPVSPQDIDISGGTKYTTHSSVKNGDYTKIDSRKLKQINISSFIPYGVVDFSNSDETGKSIMESVDKMTSSRTPIDVAITGEISMNIKCMITDFKFAMAKGKNINYSLTLSEYRWF